MTNDRLEVFGLGATRIRKIDLVMMPTFGGVRPVSYTHLAERKKMIMFLPSRQLHSFCIRGFQYWDGALVLEKLKAGDGLELCIEADNPHDPNAVAIYKDSSKLGYVPTEINESLSLMPVSYTHLDVYKRQP